MTLDLEPLYMRFPEHRDMINRRLREDAIFREMCEDFAAVYSMLVGSRDSPCILEREQVRECEELLGELGVEIMQDLHGRLPAIRLGQGDVGPAAGRGC
jgi:hypothetical protein